MYYRIALDYSHTLFMLQEKEIFSMEEEISQAVHRLGTNEFQGFTGWMTLPETFDKKEWMRIRETADRIRSNSNAFVVVGAGGSYSGARAAVEMLSHSFHNQLSGNKRQTPEIYFVGHHFSAAYMAHLLEALENKDVSVNVISKSGATTESAVAFRLLRRFLQEKYGEEEARRRIYVTTDESRGILRQESNVIGYETFTVPGDIGGRYSVLSAVGLLPMEVCGIDTEEIMRGAADAMVEYLEPHLADNPCHQYAAIRNALYRKGMQIELLVHYEPSIRFFAEWWKQLYGESEGKQGKGIFPATAQFTTDLHSLGQYIQQGPGVIFETVIHAEKPVMDLLLPKEDGEGELSFLNGKTMHEVNERAFMGTVLAHVDGGVPNMVVRVPQLTPYHAGKLFYFFQKACAVSSLLLGVNPFDHPGVEAYKKNLLALLGKPGLEAERAKLEGRTSWN